MTTKFEQAEELFFQTDLSNTEIAEMLGVSRRTIQYWIGENEWTRLKQAAQSMPCVMADKAWTIMSDLMDTILNDVRTFRSATRHEINSINKLSITIGRIRNRSTLNESMELRNHFMEYLDDQDHTLALQIQPHIDNFLKARAKEKPNKFQSQKLNQLTQYPEPEYTPTTTNTNPSSPAIALATAGATAGTATTTTQSQPAQPKDEESARLSPESIQLLTEMARATEYGRQVRQTVGAHPTTNNPNSITQSSNQNLPRKQRRELERLLLKKSKKAA